MLYIVIYSIVLLRGATYSYILYRSSLTLIVGEDLCEWLLLDLLQEEVFLVEEEDHGGLHEPLVVEDRVEQPQSFVHPILGRRGRRERE